MPKPAAATVTPFPSLLRGHAPLAGRTLLLVEDSRAASDAVRLYCQRLGARLRRADSLAAAHRHLATFRPDAVIADICLPDGSGLALISELAASRPRPAAIVGLSGIDMDEAAAAARQAGADAFLPKPIPGIDAFRRALSRIDGGPPHRERAVAACDEAAAIDDRRRALSVLRRARDVGDSGLCRYAASFVVTLTVDAGRREGDALAIRARELLARLREGRPWDRAAAALEAVLKAELRGGAPV